MKDTAVCFHTFYHYREEKDPLLLNTEEASRLTINMLTVKIAFIKNLYQGKKATNEVFGRQTSN